MDRRAFVSLFAAIPAVVVAKRAFPKRVTAIRVDIPARLVNPKRGPYDTDSKYWDKVLDADYDKDSMHLDG
jgi:hypothetical protein